MIRSDLQTWHGRCRNILLVLVPMAAAVAACATPAQQAAPAGSGSHGRASEPGPLIFSGSFTLKPDAVDFDVACVAEDGGFRLELGVKVTEGTKGWDRAETLISPEHLLVTLVTRTGAVLFPIDRIERGWGSHRRGEAHMHLVYTFARTVARGVGAHAT